MGEASKVVGIVADNYKIPKFKTELEKEGFKDYEVIVDSVKAVSVIKVKCEDTDYLKISQICRRVLNSFDKNVN